MINGFYGLKCVGEKILRCTKEYRNDVSAMPNSSARMKKMAAPQPPPSFPNSMGTHEVMAAHHSSDDCAINELLEGRMELDVILPDNRKVRMSVERRTPMMDLLVQATTANKINPGGHVIHMWKGKSGDLVHYKPNTPIGSLDSHTIYIVHKSSVIDPPIKKMPKLANKPFEQTFRLQVNLPRNQLMVLRVSPKTKLSEVKQMACTEKRLEPSKYELVHPNRLSKILDLSMTLLDYGANEVTLMSISNIQANSATDFIAFTAHEEEKKKKGILGIFSKKKNKSSTGGSSEDGPTSRAVSPCRLPENSRVGTKKRPAPLPPQIRSNNARSEAVSHSRHSSDSSGYHESSVFSDSPETSSGSGMSSLDSTDSHVNRKHINGTAKSTISQQMPVKKRKAPPPPIPAPKTELISNTTANRNENHIDASPEYDEEVVFSSSDNRRASISSLGTIDDIENSFEQTIAEAQRVIDMEEQQRMNAAGTSDAQQTSVLVGKTDVAALQARLEQNLNQQQLQSEIATAFTSVHLQIKDSIEDAKSIGSSHQTDLKSTSAGTQEKPKETLLLPVFSQKPKDITTSEESGDEVFERQNFTVRKKNRTKTKRQQKLNDGTVKKMDNFSISSYRGSKASVDASAERKTEHASLQRQTNSKKALSKSESFNVSREEWIKVHPRKSGYGGPGVRIGSFLDRSSKKKPNDNKVYGLEGSVRGIKGQVKLRCAEITDLGFSPKLKEKSRSMLNLIPEHKESTEVEISVETDKMPQDDSSIKRAVSEHNLSNIGISVAKEPKSEFAREQERLQCEYMKLEKQFVAWQQQLVSNHTLLEKERILPTTTLKRSTQSEDYKDKTIIFPNGVKPSRAVLRARESQSLTRRPKSELANITLSTWDSQKRMEYLTLPANVTTQDSCGVKNGEKKIDIGAMEFQMKAKQSTNGLRSSTTKIYFKPPELRSSSHTRQRLPPEVRTEEDNFVVNTDDGRGRSSRRDKFQRNISQAASSRNQENNDNSRRDRNKECDKSRDAKKAAVPPFDKNPTNRSIIENCSKESVPSYTYFGGSVSNGYYLGLEPERHNYLESWSKKEIEQKDQGEKKDIKEANVVSNKCTSIVPPPPPLPMPSESAVKQQSGISKNTDRRKALQTCSLDPREELMIEVRKFGGRSGLRKVSTPESSWQLTVFGSSVHH